MCIIYPTFWTLLSGASEESFIAFYCDPRGEDRGVEEGVVLTQLVLAFANTSAIAASPEDSLQLIARAKQALDRGQQYGAVR